jgi:hypothetical protein
MKYFKNKIPIVLSSIDDTEVIAPIGTLFTYNDDNLRCNEIINNNIFKPLNDNWKMLLINNDIFEKVLNHETVVINNKLSNIMEYEYDTVNKKTFKIELKVDVTEKQAYLIEKELREFLNEIMKKY